MRIPIKFKAREKMPFSIILPNCSDVMHGSALRSGFITEKGTAIVYDHPDNPTNEVLCVAPYSDGTFTVIEKMVHIELREPVQMNEFAVFIRAVIAAANTAYDDELNPKTILDVLARGTN